MAEGSVELALAVALLFIGGLVVETRILLRWRTDLWFSLAFPLGQELLPVRSAPTGEGRTASVRWEVASPGVVRWWADPDERKAPSGLRGLVHLVASSRGVELDFRWAPPLSPLLAAVWLAALGLARGEAGVTIPIAVAIVVGLGVVYWSRARRIAAELRLAFSGSEPDDDAAL